MMRLHITILLFIAIAFACSDNKRKEAPLYVPKGSMLFFDSASGEYKISSKDTSLITAWKSFVEAASKADVISLKSMSTACIWCLKCMELDETFRIMGVDEFYRDHANFIFDSFFVSLMNDNEHVRGSYKRGDWYPDYPCIPRDKGIVNPKGVNIYVSFPLRKGDIEGSAAILDFIETESGYKFYGYSTIP